ncbi:branched-chain amino acid ABC transporter permease [Cupriavidus pauculus]|uniref:Branched-chain amino acid ABC transporter permease n=2 Tax=Cupriavidus pauculus TaxID=82633 RepID=A0A2N5C2Q7_9BURK|nr:branched-chain amino acid ABC transporter permease [Cupriavidus pauculus]
MTVSKANINTVIGVPMMAIASVLPLFVQDSYALHSLIMILYFAYMASAWNFVCGYVGQLSLGHSVFAGGAGYISVLLFTQLGISPWLGMLAGGLAAALLSICIGYPTFKLKGPYFTLTTIAFAEIVRIWLENTDDFLGIPLKGAQGLVIPPSQSGWLAFQFDSKVPYYYIILIMLAVMLLATVALERSRLGYYLKAIRGDEAAAQAVGVSTTRYPIIALAISAFMTGLGGAFYAQFFRYINPERNMGLDLSIDSAIMAIVGGQGTIIGPVLGAFVLHPIAEFARAWFAGKFLGLHLVIYGLILMAAVLYFPKGIIGPLERLLRFRRRPAASANSVVAKDA